MEYWCKGCGQSRNLRQAESVYFTCCGLELEKIAGYAGGV